MQTTISEIFSTGGFLPIVWSKNYYDFDHVEGLRRPVYGSLIHSVTCLDITDLLL